MSSVNKNLERIGKTWNDFFWENKFCQRQINFTSEVRTNYYGDIITYFNDTLAFLENPEFDTDFQKSIFQAIGILQTIYTHQDLTDELLYIFKLPKSTKNDKSPIREIRNELVGHPIRRRDGELLSSVFFGREFKNGKIHYILYSKEVDFRGKEVVLSVQSLIDKHKEYLEKFTLLIWERIKKILRTLQKKLCVIKSLIEHNVEFDKLLKVVDHYYNEMFKHNYLFDPIILSECFNRQDDHPRYKNAINLFISKLEEYLVEEKKNIDDIFNENNASFDEVVTPTITIRFVGSDDDTTPVQNNTEHLHYEFSKLFENHPVFGVEYFLKKFNDIPEITAELINMKNNQEVNLEFYSSYEYLRILLIDKGVLTR